MSKPDYMQRMRRGATVRVETNFDQSDKMSFLMRSSLLAWCVLPSGL